MSIISPSFLILMSPSSLLHGGRRFPTQSTHLLAARLLHCQNLKRQPFPFRSYNPCPQVAIEHRRKTTVSSYSTSIQLPVSRNPSSRSLYSTISTTILEGHNKDVARISAKVREYFESNEKFRIFHGSTNSTRPDRKRNLVDTSGLNHVLAVDTVRKTCLVEPNVPMDRLVEATMKHGLVPPVVMEFPGITVGGGYSGTSGESSSFKHGFFNETINFVEMVLADGEVVKLSRTEKEDLFRGAAGALGTFGVTTLVELQLQDAKSFVETTYHPVTSMKDAIVTLREATRNSDLDYVDGIMFSKTEGAVITGKMTNELRPDLTIHRFSSAWDPWFYLHVQDIVRQGASPSSEAIPLAEYLFRYDRGGFWVGASAFDWFKMPFNKLTRWWLDDFLHTRMMYTALHASGQSKQYVVQDLALPYSTAEAFVNYTDEAFNIYPLWLCPLKQSHQPTMHPHSNDLDASGAPEEMLNIGLWGPGSPDHEMFIAANRDLEAKLKELGGMKWLYAHTYYTEQEFWAMFDQEWYERLRRKYKADRLTSVYEKVKVDIDTERKAALKRNRWLNVWPFSGFYGIKKAIESRTYIAARSSAWKTFGRDLR